MDEAFIRHFARHFVSIWCLRQRLDARGKPHGQPESFHISAFVLSVRDEWLLITAGHIIRKIDEDLQKKRRRIVQSYLIDDWGPKADHRDAIPFEFESVPRGRFGDEHDFDYGFFYLNSNHRALLQQNGIQPVAENAWRNPPPDPDRHYILGIPDEFVRNECLSTLEGPVVSSRPAITFHQVDRVAERPPGMPEKAAPRVYGHIALPPSGDKGEPPPSSIIGMSGGPIFGLKELAPGRVAYWVVGVQSSWHKLSKTIAWCPLEPLARHIDDQFGRIEKQVIDPDDR